MNYIQIGRVFPFKIKHSHVAEDRSFYFCFRSFIPKRSKFVKWIYLHSKHQKSRGKCQM